MSKERLEQMEHDYKNAFPIEVEWLLNYAKEQAERAQKNAQDLEDMDKQIYSEQQRVEDLENHLKMANQYVEKEREINTKLKNELDTYKNKFTVEYTMRIRKQNKHYREINNKLITGISEITTMDLYEDAYDKACDLLDLDSESEIVFTNYGDEESQYALQEENKRLREVIGNIKKASRDFREGHLLDIQDSYFVDEIIAIIKALESEPNES